MYSKTIAISALVAIAQARFGQEQTPVSFITALSNFGSSGEAATLAGGVPGVLLAAANPCDKLTLADKIVTTLGTDPAVIAGAAQVVAAEQNFNPFVVSIPNICGDASLPATAELRGIVPLVDPAVTGSDTENANQATSIKTPFDATGLSVAEVMIAQGFSNFSVAGVDQSAGNTGNTNNAGSSASASGAATSVASSTTAVSCNKSKTTASAVASATGAASVTTSTASAAATSVAASAATGAGAVSDPVTGTFAGFQASSLGLDFGTCTPTVKFEESLNGRKAGESTFQAQDPVVNKGQQEALNPAIIFNRICDQLTNVCGAAADAKAACQQAQSDLSTAAKDVSTADAWNTALGFAGTNTNPDNAPQTGLVGHT